MSKGIFHKTVSLDEALKLIADACFKYNIQPIASETINVRDALHRITAKPVFARFSSPPYHSSAMDGYAVNFAQTSLATEVSPVRLQIGSQAKYVDTGDPMPEGCNAVVKIEDVNIVGDSIEIYSAVPPYSNVRVIGEDIVASELIVSANHLIRPIDISAMLASGVLQVEVRKKPFVTIIPTGTEMRAPEDFASQKVTPPHLIEYNSVMLQGLLKQTHCESFVTEILPDDLNLLRETITKAVEKSDLVLVIAGSGKGTEDYTAKVLGQLGEIIFHGVSIKPGKPTIFAVIDKKPVFGMPGYPVSTYLAFDLFVSEVLQRLLSYEFVSDSIFTAKIGRQLNSQLGIDEFVRVKVGQVKDSLIAIPVGRGAGLMMSLVRADAILKIPSKTEALTQNSKVKIKLLKPLSDIENTVICIGSHDNVLDVLANQLKVSFPKLTLSSAHVGSLGGIMAIKNSEAHIAGIHLLDDATAEYNIPFIKRLIPNLPVVLVHLVCRTQGFIVQKGNPKGITSLNDLLRDDVVFVNRQRGSGTRLLFDKILKEAHINPQNIKGYSYEEYTHMAVASAVSSGIADVGLGVYASAVALNLDFIPIANERFDILMLKDFYESQKGKALLEVIKCEDFIKSVQSLGGYEITSIGTVLYQSN